MSSRPNQVKESSYMVTGEAGRVDKGCLELDSEQKKYTTWS